MLAREPGIFVAAGVIPGPAVEAIFLNVRDVIGRKEIAEGVAFVDGGPKFAGIRIDGDADGVSNSGGVDAQI